MRIAVTAQAGRGQVLTATGHHPYARLHTGDGEEVRAYLADRAAVWHTAGTTGPTWHALGDSEPAVRVMAAVARTLLGEFEVVTLGVLTGNHRAARIYRRLGFLRSTGRTSVDLAH